LLRQAGAKLLGGSDAVVESFRIFIARIIKIMLKPHVDDFRRIARNVSPPARELHNV